MNVVERTVGLLDNWAGSRDPSPADVQHMIGSWAARSMIQYFFVERLVAIAWVNIDPAKKPPNNYIDYDFWVNYFSDLGARGCHTLDPGKATEHYVCSPLFALADLSIMLVGIGVFVAAALITSTVLRLSGKYEELQQERKLPKPGHAGRGNFHLLLRHIGGEHHGRDLTWRHHVTTIMRFLMGITGIALIFVGGFPEDYDPNMHDASTLTFLVCAIATLLCLIILWWKLRPVATALIAVSTLVAIIGGVVLLIALITNVTPPLHGLFERMIVYGFIGGMTVMGVALGSGAREERRARRAPRAPAAQDGENPGNQRLGHRDVAAPERLNNHRVRTRIVTLNGHRWIGLIDIQGEPQLHPERAGER